MTHTTPRPEIHPQALLISSSQGSSSRRQQQWIFLYWIMLSSDVEGLILLAWGTAASGKRGSFD
jgi:hypothetical protein